MVSSRCFILGLVCIEGVSICNHVLDEFHQRVPTLCLLDSKILPDIWFLKAVLDGRNFLLESNFQMRREHPCSVWWFPLKVHPFCLINITKFFSCWLSSKSSQTFDMVVSIDCFTLLLLALHLGQVILDSHSQDFSITWSLISKWCTINEGKKRRENKIVLHTVFIE